MHLVRGKLRRLSDSIRSLPGCLSELRSASPTPDRRVPYGYAGVAHRRDSDAVGVDSDSPVEYMVVSQTPERPPHEIDEPDPQSDNMLAPSPRAGGHSCDVQPSRQPDWRCSPAHLTMTRVSTLRPPNPGQTTIYQRGATGALHLPTTRAASPTRHPLAGAGEARLIHRMRMTAAVTTVTMVTTTGQGVSAQGVTLQAGACTPHNGSHWHWTSLMGCPVSGRIIRSI